MQKINDIKALIKEIESDTDNSLSPAIIREKYLSKNSPLQVLGKSIHSLSSIEDKKEFGLLYNRALSLISEYIDSDDSIHDITEKEYSFFDYSVYFDQDSLSNHPLSALMDLILRTAINLGFDIFSQGPEVENDWYNFTALNIAPDHPARDMWDTFYLKKDTASSNDELDGQKDMLLRTHTSPMQIHYMESHQPPVKALFPGRVFRNEDEDSTHLAVFYQLEGLVIDKNVNLGHLKYYLKRILSIVLEDEIDIRLRSSYFPFTEPSVEIDVLYKGKWLEIAGAGMVSPRVLTNMNIDHMHYSGFAFGFGLERIAVVKYGLSDIRQLWNLSISNIYKRY
jgi:phenylalanyl-tRNA synthetase alpha chain